VFTPAFGPRAERQPSVSKRIAAVLHIMQRTVEIHRVSIMKRMWFAFQGFLTGVTDMFFSAHSLAWASSRFTIFSVGNGG